MVEYSKEYKTNITGTGTYQFGVLLLGLINALSTIQKIMEAQLKNISFLQIYLDDVAVHS